MTKICIARDELYPVYSLHRGERYRRMLFEIPEDKIKWINETTEEFDKVQDYLREIYDD